MHFWPVNLIPSLLAASFFVACLIGLVIGAENDPILQTRQGTIRGVLMKSRNDKQFAAYLSIPYARPPVDDHRLRPPVKASNWKDERDGTKNPPACIQQVVRNGKYTHIGQEDCLYVNVYTPKGARSDERRSTYPVMVFIHGGPAIAESSSDVLGPQYLLDKDIVLVTFNYRQNRLGFLSLEDKNLSGNFGLKDQVMALKWIQENIESYGGDNKQVTMVGQSGGAVSVGMHMISPLSRGLFQQVIMESGSSLSFWAVNHKGIKRAETLNFIQQVNCQHDNAEQVLKCLRNLPVEKFYYSDDRSIEETIERNMPIVRESEDAPEPFLTGNPWDEITRINQYPLLMGINSAEGDVVTNPLYSDHRDVVNRIDDESEKYFPSMLGYFYTIPDAEDRKTTTRKVKTHYFDNGKSMINSFQEFVQMYTDRGFAQPAIDTLRNYKNQQKYFYYYDHINENRFVYGKYKVPFGASHGEELISLFYLPQIAPDGLRGNDRLVSDQIVEYWTNFVAYGTPNGEQRTAVKTRWEPVNDDNGRYLYIGNDTLEMRSRLRKEGYDLWNSFNIEHDF